MPKFRVEVLTTEQVYQEYSLTTLNEEDATNLFQLVGNLESEELIETIDRKILNVVNVDEERQRLKSESNSKKDASSSEEESVHS